MKYLVVYEQGDSNWSAYAPDLPGCMATGVTHEETAETMREAIAFHIDGLREGGDAIPAPSAQVGMVEVPGEPAARYLVVFGRESSGYEAHAPDLLPECEALGETLDEVREMMKKAITGYVEELREDGRAIPEPSAQVGTVEVELAVA